MKYIIALLISTIGIIASPLDNISVSPFAAFSHNLDGGTDYGAGLGLSYKFNKYVAGRVSAVSYSNNDWRGTAIDEGSLLVEATLLRSANNGVRLYAVGGLDRSFSNDDWGFGAGGGLGFTLHKNVELFGESRVRVFEKQDAGILTSAGLTFRF